MVYRKDRFNDEFTGGDFYFLVKAAEIGQLNFANHYIKTYTAVHFLQTRVRLISSLSKISGKSLTLLSKNELSHMNYAPFRIYT